ncbi:nitrilase-related carbon-nitrogen hydrolase [Bythopirellula polymerisocia]|uniref:Nitrilase n=1 Tax=Bythopirellula polymerisocia TaxID=2528003 RepID=A0A5C6CSZ6_9BACT|nr:nitrilase-related carbon-nitrogen hydrolase [Bythopirellula polymerisocia]TWU27518.1 Nitrilase [Bythopirellula polymerisocia]
MNRSVSIFLLLAITFSPLTCLTAAESNPDQLRIAGIVLKWIRGDRDANISRLFPLVRKAAANGAQIVCTTECFLDGYAIEDKEIPLADFRALGEIIPGGTFYEQLRQLADELDIYLIAGMLESDGDQLYNTAVVLDPQGQLLGKYHKQMLGHESVRVSPGDESSVIETPFGKLGVMICADRSNEEVVQQFCSRGADLLICPSGGMFGPEKNDHILQRRSKENKKYIVFTHPDEFLVTTPEGEIAQRVLLGEKLNLDDDETGTTEDSSGVFFTDFQRRKGAWRASSISKALSQPLLQSGLSKKQVRSYVDARIPKVELPAKKAEWKNEAARLREEFLARVIYQGEAAAWRDAEVKVEWFNTIDEGNGYRIKKFRYEALPGFWIPGLLYEPEVVADKMPVMINPNGHHRGGKAMPYKQRRCINLARRGVLAYNLEFIDMGQLHDGNNKHNRLVQLDLCGTSGVAPFYLALKRGLDIALSHEHADSTRVGVTGLSGGGWQSIWLAALDTRVTVANPVAGYCSIHERVSGDNNIGDAEQIPSDLCSVADYTHLTAMMAPRPLLLTYNAQDDCCFVPTQILEPLETVGRAAYGLLDVDDNFQIHINEDPGTHNFDQDNREALYRFLKQHHFFSDPDIEPVELSISDAEIKSEEELAVPMPANNLTLHELALKLIPSLTSQNSLPAEEATVFQSLDRQRQLLNKIVQRPHYDVKPEFFEREQLKEITISQWRLNVGGHWTIPVVEFDPVDSNRETYILLSDWGKQSMITDVARLVAGRNRVLALDLLGFGEADPGSDPKSYDDVMLMLIATVGDRPLGIQVAQLTAIAQWATRESGEQLPRVFATGPRNSLIGLVAAALETRSIAGIELRQARQSLREIIEQNLKVEDGPEQFCFGLLEQFDVPQLVAMVKPRPIVLGDINGDND